MTQKEPFFSIIIPLYESECYVEECLLSLKNQTFKDFECIVVSDGSPGVDLSNKEWFRKDFKNNLLPYGINKNRQTEWILNKLDDKRFKYFYKDNGGQGTAQNLALKKTKGKHLVVIDSDDFISIDFLEKACDRILKNTEKKIIYNKIKIYEKGIKSEYKKILKNYIPCNSIASNLVFPNFTCTPFNYFWPLEMIKKNNIEFRFPRRGHDTCFYFECLLAHYKQGGVLKHKEIDTYYFYRQREGQTTKKYSEKMVFDHIYTFLKKERKDFYKINLKSGWLSDILLLRLKIYSYRIGLDSKIKKIIISIFIKPLTFLSLLIYKIK